ncbi:MAG: DUF1273 domain-containing protein [Ruminococcus sp.]|nr:DUF1273 domain-containing protein [Ruminococcus sp.]
MRKETCCFSGHRKIPPNEKEIIAKRLKHEIVNLIHQGVKYFGTGGALGFDTIAAQTIIELRSIYPQIRLILVFPCKTQSQNWSEADKAIYEKIKNECDKCVYISDEYTYDCMHKRNRHLVNYSDFCICYLTKNHGGTAYTVEYAIKNGLKIINIVPNNFNVCCGE